ncbi:TaqI-like C-terminal specificity domain-containing protein [Flavobacterium sp. GSP6]|uniref:Eco57I restriction-modification methylase domain-containing protein n=1 Tax=Flavobacterium sp. GSP6 TaxID=2497488 RepID=UPI000F86E3D4|nr:TaqI-like C-terminal specificity domain-containing protein [Flavobacterium sp. GSP6]RTZ09014.1 hypothetical protein EKM03_00015 [Flavobacterium sp. GSP6]
MHIDNLIYTFSQNNLTQFLRNKIPTFKQGEDDLSYLFDDEVFEKYESIVKIGEATIQNDDLIVITSKTSDPLTEKSGKKNQYEIAKKILKEELKDAALFIFFDDEGNFRFSFVKANYLGNKRNFTDFKRYSYFVSSIKANKTFKKQVGECNFSSLDEIIKSFSVEPLNKLFYQEISKAFYELIGGKITIASKKYDFNALLELPSTPLANRKIYQEFAVRLIGRTIFCWFLKNKKSEAKKPLIPENWLSSDTVDLLSNGGLDYYHDYLEKLFFLILNKKQDERKDYELPVGEESIPFLNGGLFEPHPYDFFPRDSNGIHKMSYGLKIPNKWFFKLFEVLESFNFTIDENSINDAEVSIDPEMLGTIFENLLAEIDPDTEKSARKATGSFYTPREIVDYMVEQSIIQYLKTKTSVEDEIALQNLFKEGGENEFDSEQTEEILEALNTVKILDPACGSGAFPMGALHKIITVLHKLDPDASWWKEKQIENIPNALARKYMQEKLDKESADYIRKLGVIQNSIYGVDIQPIATEISKLRSFLSLIIDENIVDDAENRGIEPLPNLEFKFVSANTLIGLPDESGQQGMFNNYEELQLLEQLRSDYLQSSGKKKNEIKERFLRVQKKAFVIQNNLFADTNSRAYKLMSWNPFNDDASTWFDPEWMFGVKRFDIIIQNPPYVQLSKLKNTSESYKKYLKARYNTSGGRLNTFIFFLHLSLEYLSENGQLSLIIPNTILTQDYYTYTRELILAKFQLNEIVNYDKMPFENAVVENVTLFIQKKRTNKNIKITSDNLKSIELIKELNSSEFIKQDNYSFNFKSNSFIDKLFTQNNIIRLEELCLVNQGIALKGDKSASILYDNNSESNHYKLLDGRNINKYSINWTGEFLDYSLDRIHSCKRKDIFESDEKLFFRRVSGKLIFTYDNQQYFALNTLVVVNHKPKNTVNLKYLLAILNSTLLNYLYVLKFKSTKKVFSEIQANSVQKLPIKLTSKQNESNITLLIDTILELKKQNLPTIELENKIDNFIYKLYEVNYDEIKVIDPEFMLTKEEYENYTIE